MNRIFITGDTHGDIDISKLNTKNFQEQKQLTKEDYMIICGDFGGVWYGDRDVEQEHPDYEVPPKHRQLIGKDAYWLDWYQEKNFTTLFIDGNHENHDLLDCYPVTLWHGGKVHVIRPGIIHLMRGQVYELAEKTIFTMGGASSTDRIFRKEKVDWWERELPSEEEMKEAEQNLGEHDFRVDYVITHCIGNDIMDGMKEGWRKRDRLTAFLSSLDRNITYKKWYFGHFHADRDVDEKHRLLYEDIIELT